MIQKKRNLIYYCHKSREISWLIILMIMVETNFLIYYSDKNRRDSRCKVALHFGVNHVRTRSLNATHGDSALSMGLELVEEFILLMSSVVRIHLNLYTEYLVHQTRTSCLKFWNAINENSSTWHSYCKRWRNAEVKALKEKVIKYLWY